MCTSNNDVYFNIFVGRHKCLVEMHWEDRERA